MKDSEHKLRLAAVYLAMAGENLTRASGAFGNTLTDELPVDVAMAWMDQAQTMIECLQSMRRAVMEDADRLAGYNPQGGKL